MDFPLVLTALRVMRTKGVKLTYQGCNPSIPHHKKQATT